MSNEKTLAAKEAPRLNQLFDNLVGTLRDFIRENRVTHEEYRRAVGFLTEAGAKGEIPLLFDVFVEVTVDEVDNNGRPGTRTTVEGPFYLPNSPVLKSPCVLPHRKDEPGTVLFLSGSVRGQDGRPLPGAVVDMWQSDSDGRYSHFDIPAETARNNLRARVIADDQGGFEVQTWMPGAYEIPKHGPTGAVLTTSLASGASAYEGRARRAPDSYHSAISQKRSLDRFRCGSRGSQAISDCRSGQT
jgi:catechol 1,2-dioxygenase